MATEKLAIPVSVNFRQRTNLKAILDRLTEKTGVRFLIDWEATSKIGWTYETEALLFADNEPLAKALSKLLRPMELTYYVVDEKTIQITTVESLVNRVELAVYPVADLLDEGIEGPHLAEAIPELMG